jgi:hypothetical protein
LAASGKISILNDSSIWQQALSVVDFAGIPGALSFYIAEATDNETIELRHRAGGYPPLVVDTHVFNLRYRVACEQSATPNTGFIFEILRDMLPPLCEACGHEVSEGALCIECRASQIEDLLRMTDPAAPTR